MKRRAARILVPLAVELAFAAAVFAAIRATDGGRYGLGAKAALERLAARYRDCATYQATVREALGAYPHLRHPSDVEARQLRTVQVVYKRPAKAAGSLAMAGETIYGILNGGTARFVGEITVSRDPDFLLPTSGIPWDGPYAHFALLPLASVRPRVDTWPFPFPYTWVRYVGLQCRRGPGGRAHDVLVLWGRFGNGEVWIEPDGGYACAVVYPGLEQPYTEVYEDVAFDEPVEEALFDLDGDGFERLKAWIAEREKARTR